MSTKYLVFNELSVCTEITDIDDSEARQRIDDFVILLQKLRSEKLISGIICTSDIYNFHVSKTYGIQEWLSDRETKHSYKQFFRTMCNKNCTYIEPLNYMNEFSVNINEQDYNAIGCLVAIETEQEIVSVINNTYWEQDTIQGKYTYIDDLDKVVIENREISNISKLCDAARIKNRIVEDAYSYITSGQDLWEVRKTIFPNLIFCENVKDQLYEDSEKFHIMRVIEKLKRLQEYFETYDGIYDPKKLGHNARTESDTVKTNNSLKNERLFRKPDGSEVYFYDHIGFSGKYSAGRIYFLPDDEERVCYIGYIGRHLHTKNF